MKKEMTWQQWVRLVERETKTNPGHPSRLRPGCLAPLTGTDFRAMSAFVECLKLYGNADHPERVRDAIRLVLGEMQASVRWIARELIPFVREWGDREHLWALFEPTPPRFDDDDFDMAAASSLGRAHP